MKYHLDRTIRCAPEQEHPTLYKWSLQEFSDDRGALTAKLIPWWWSLYFTGTELALFRSVEVEHSSNGEPQKHANSGERIVVTLAPDERGSGWARQTSYSMFGTDRLIRNFTLSVTTKGPADAQELCTAHGWPRYSTDADESFPAETTDDALRFELSVPEQDFAALRLAIQRNAGNVGVTFMVSGVHGFYAEWGPGISTKRVKVLADAEQRVDVPAGVGQPPRLGTVSKCSLQLTLRSTLAPLRIEAAKADERDETPVVQMPQPQVLVDELSAGQADKRLLASVEALHAAVNRNRLPLWLLFVIALTILLLRVG